MVRFWGSAEKQRGPHHKGPDCPNAPRGGRKMEAGAPRAIEFKERKGCLNVLENKRNVLNCVLIELILLLLLLLLVFLSALWHKRSTTRTKHYR